MQTKAIDFKAIMSRTDFLTGDYARDVAKNVRLITPQKIRALVTARHPSVNREKLYTVVKPV